MRDVLQVFVTGNSIHMTDWVSFLSMCMISSNPILIDKASI